MGTGVGGADAACGLSLVEALIHRALVGRAIFSAPTLNIVLSLVAAGGVARVLFAVVGFRTLLAIEAALKAALVRETKVAA